MAWLKHNTNLVWCGFYLAPAPSHPGTSWMPQFAWLNANGWGVAPIYVGQQITGPGSHHTSGPQGHVDGLQTVSLLMAAGFPHGTCVYLDLENGPPFTSIQRDYVATWYDTVTASPFQAGVYCSHLYALEVHQLRSNARVWAVKVPTTHPHPVPGPNFPTSHPAGSGYTGAYAWQLAMNCQLSLPGAPLHSLDVDLDTSVSPNPGI